MKEIEAIFNKCTIFKGLNKDIFINELKKTGYYINNYSKNEIIAIEDSVCNSIGIIISGNVEVQKIFVSGRAVTIEKLDEGNIFGEVIVFSKKHTYPATITAVNKSKILFITKNDIINLCNVNRTFFINFMTLLSNKILMLNNKVKKMSYTSIKQKIADYLLTEYKKQKTLKIKINKTKKELAEILGVQRPSLSRELMYMKRKKLIDYNKNYIIINNFQDIEEILYK